MRGCCPCHVPAVQRMWIHFYTISCLVFCCDYSLDVTAMHFSFNLITKSNQSQVLEVPKSPNAVKYGTFFVFLLIKIMLNNKITSGLVSYIRFSAPFQLLVGFFFTFLNSKWNNTQQASQDKLLTLRKVSLPFIFSAFSSAGHFCEKLTICCTDTYTHTSIQTHTWPSHCSHTGYAN